MPCAEIAEAGMLRPRGRGIFGASPGREANAVDREPASYNDRRAGSQ